MSILEIVCEKLQAQTVWVESWIDGRLCEYKASCDFCLVRRYVMCVWNMARMFCIHTQDRILRTWKRKQQVPVLVKKKTQSTNTHTHLQVCFQRANHRHVSDPASRISLIHKPKIKIKHLKWILEIWTATAWSWCIWLRIRKISGLLQTREWKLRIEKTWGNFLISRGAIGIPLHGVSCLPDGAYSEPTNFVLLTNYHSGDQIKKSEMDRTCIMYGGDERCI